MTRKPPNISQAHLLPQRPKDGMRRYVLSFHAKWHEQGDWQKVVGEVLFSNLGDLTMVVLVKEPFVATVEGVRWGKGGPARAFKPGQDGWDVKIRGDRDYLWSGNEFGWACVLEMVIQHTIVELILA